MDEHGSPQDHLTPAARTRRWWAGLAGVVAALIAVAIVIALAVVPHPPDPGQQAGSADAVTAPPSVDPQAGLPEPTASESVVHETAAAQAEPEPAAEVADFAGWIAGSRALLGEDTATDEGMLLIGVTLCAQMPLSEEEAAAYAVAESAGGASMSADEWLAVAALADRTLCPSGTMLAEPSTDPVEVVEPPVGPCPRIPSMKPRLRLVSTKPAADGGVMAIIDVTLTNPADHEVWISARLVDRVDDNPELYAPDSPGALWDYRLPGGRTTTERIEVHALDGPPRHLDWGFWTVAGVEFVGDDGLCEDAFWQR